jgi:hypothetical protein
VLLLGFGAGAFAQSTVLTGIGIIVHMKSGTFKYNPYWIESSAQFSSAAFMLRQRSVGNSLEDLELLLTQRTLIPISWQVASPHSEFSDFADNYSKPRAKSK